jgi:hypothetical protein
MQTLNVQEALDTPSPLYVNIDEMTDDKIGRTCRVNGTVMCTL